MMVSRKRIVFLTVAVLCMGLWSMQFFTGNLTWSQIVSRVGWRQPQNKAVNRTGNRSGDITGKQLGNFRESLTGDRVRSQIASHVGRKTADHAQNQIITGIRSRNKENARCIKRKTTHITFLKVHKAGSSTMTYMFFRFGIRNNLTFVLQKDGKSYALAGGRSDDILPVKEGEHYDIFALHSIYNRTKFNRLLPADSVRIGIIRDPLERMVSAAYYYRDVTKLPYLLAVPPANFIVNLIRNHSIYEKNEFSHTKNYMAKDFGFPAKTTQNMTKFISSYISQLTLDFKLVLVMEKFEESLILMKRYLNWELSDILYFTAANSHEHENVSLNAADIAQFKHVSFLDFAIYEEFSKIFEKKIELEGKTFVDEVKHFKAVQSLVKDFCSRKSSLGVLHILASRWTCAFVVTALDCQYIKRDSRVVSLSILIKRHIEMHGNM